MAVMRFPVRTPFATLVPLLLLVPVAASTGACSSGTDAEDSGPTVTATGPDRSTDSSTDDGPSDRSDQPTSAETALPDAVTALCTPYAAMVEAVEDAAAGTRDREAIAAEIGPVMKEFAAQLPSLERPPGLSQATWQGVQALARRILELPDRPSNAEIEAVEGDLTEQERDALKTAADWLRTNCPL